MATASYDLGYVARANERGALFCARCGTRVIVMHGEAWCPVHGDLPLPDEVAELRRLAAG